MKREAEDPTWHLLKLSPFVFGVGKLGEGPRDFNVLIGGRFVISPSDPLGPEMLGDSP